MHPPRRRPSAASRWFLGHAVLVDGPNSTSDGSQALPDENEAEPRSEDALGECTAESESGTASYLTAAELRWLHHLAIRRAERERKRIERDLHDGVQVHLIQMAINITKSLDSLDAPIEHRRQALLELRQQAHQALGAVREICRGLYPSLLRVRGLVPALTALADRSDDHLTVHADADVHALRLLPHVAEHLYFFVYEAVTNAWKHASPSEAESRLPVEVGLSLEGDQLRITVQDHGRGFDVERTQPGHGLLTMEDRLRQLGGRLTIQSYPGRGTVVNGFLPLRPEHLAIAR